MQFLWRSDSENSLRKGPTFAVLVGALVLGALLNADALLSTAEAQAPGWERNLTLRPAEALAEVSDALYLDEPHEALIDWLDREAETVDPAVPSPGTVFVPSAARPARLWVAGDSLVETVGAAIVNEAAATGVIEARFDVQYSSGLARPELFDWRREVAAQLAATPADIVVFMVGANDGQAIRIGDDFAPFGSAEWDDQYSARVDALMDQLAASTASVYWLGLPVAADEERAARFAAMNDIYSAAASTRPGVTFIDVFERFAGLDGGYTALLPDAAGRLIRARDPDGIHFTPAGAEMVADLVLATIADDWQLPE